MGNFGWILCAGFILLFIVYLFIDDNDSRRPPKI